MTRTYIFLLVLAVAGLVLLMSPSCFLGEAPSYLCLRCSVGSDCPEQWRCVSGRCQPQGQPSACAHLKDGLGQPDGVSDASVDAALDQAPEPSLTDGSIEPIAEKSSEPIAEKSSEPIAEKSSEPIAEKRTEPAIEKPAESLPEPEPSERSEPPVESSHEQAPELRPDGGSPDAIPDLSSPDAPAASCFPSRLTRTLSPYGPNQSTSKPFYGAEGSSKGSYLLAFSDTQGPVLWDVPMEKIVRTSTSTKTISGASFSFDDSEFAHSHLYHAVHIYNRISNSSVASFSRTDCCAASAFSRDGRYFAYGWRLEPRFYIVDRKNSNTLYSLPYSANFPKNMYSLYMSFDKAGDKLYVSSGTVTTPDRQFVEIYDVLKPTQPATLLQERGSGQPMAHGEWFALIEGDKTPNVVKLYDVGKGKVVYQVKDPEALTFNNIRFHQISRDGAYYAYLAFFIDASGKVTQKLRYWELKNLSTTAMNTTPTGTLVIPPPNPGKTRSALSNFHFGPNSKSLWVPMGGGTDTGVIFIYKCP